MKTAKLGALFMISVMALAGIGAGYAAWTDTIYIEGTVNTGNVDIVIEKTSGTEVWKDLDTDDCVIIRYIWDTEGEILHQFGEIPDNGLLVSYAYTTITGDDEITCTFNNIFPLPDDCYIADVFLHYDGSIPVKINEISYETEDEWIQDLIDDGYVHAIGCRWYPDTHEFGECVYEGYQLHQCEWVCFALFFNLPQEEEYMNQEGSFTITIEVVQWNEYPYGD